MGFTEKALALLYETMQRIKRETGRFINLPERRRGRWGQGALPLLSLDGVACSGMLVLEGSLSSDGRLVGVRHPCPYVSYIPEMTNRSSVTTGREERLRMST